MKLSTCIVSSDLTPLYLDFFPLVSRAWRDIVGVRAVLALVANEIPPPLLPLASDILLVPPTDGVNLAFHAQCLRLLVPQLLNAPANDAIIISDIDMIPMSRDYYLHSLKSVPPTEFVVYRSNALPASSRQIAMCYSAATPRVWAEMFGAVESIQELNILIGEWSNAAKADALHEQSEWSFDQRLLFSRVADFEQSRVRRITDAQTHFFRLDRGGMRRDISFIQASLARRHFYADYHMKRPYNEFSELNDRIAAMVASGHHRPWPIDDLLYRIDRMLYRAFR